MDGRAERAVIGSLFTVLRYRPSSPRPHSPHQLPRRHAVLVADRGFAIQAPNASRERLRVSRGGRGELPRPRRTALRVERCAPAHYSSPSTTSKSLTVWWRDLSGRHSAIRCCPRSTKLTEVVLRVPGCSPRPPRETTVEDHRHSKRAHRWKPSIGPVAHISLYGGRGLCRPATTSISRVCLR